MPNSKLRTPNSEFRTPNSELRIPNSKLRTQNFALILAAGLSTRMGRCKTTLPWRNGQTLLYYQAEQFLLAGITPIIVLGSHNAHRQSDRPQGSLVVINHRCSSGKTSSILAGLQSLPESFASVTISAVDQPRSARIYQSLLQAYCQEQPLITAPCYRGKLGHPLLFSSKLLPALQNIRESKAGLREIVGRFYSKIEKVNLSSEVLTDLNEPDKYQLELEKLLIKNRIKNYGN